MRNGKGLSIFTIAAIILCITSAKFCLIDSCQKAIAKNSKDKDNKAKNNKDKDNKAKNSKNKDNKGKDNKTANKASNKPQNSPISEGQVLDWRKASKDASVLVFHNKFTEADSIFLKILPLARKDDPNGIDLGICLLRYGYCLAGEEKYQQALPYLEEALKTLQKTPETIRQKKAMFQTVRALSIAYLRLNQFEKGEKFARKAIAYRIAFPQTSSLDYFKGTYRALRICLEKQNKIDEANIIDQIINNLS